MKEKDKSNSHTIVDPSEFNNQDNMIFTNEMQPLPDEEVQTIEKFIKKRTKRLLKTLKKFLYFFLSIALYSITHLFIRYNAVGTDQFLLPYFQIASLTIFIPLSFLQTNITENCTKKKEKETIEKTSSEMEERMNDNFSEIMETKFYENYFEYSSKFYVHTIVLSALYYISVLSYYWGLYYIPPLIGNSIFASTVIILQIIRLANGKYKFNLLSNFILIFYSCGLACLFGYIYNSNNFKSFPYLGVISFSISAITTALLIYYYNFIIKKFRFYINIFELVGFMGLFCLLIVPFILIVLSYLTTDGILLPMGNQLLFVVGKAMLCSCVNDVIIFYCISLFSMSVEVTSLGSLIILLYVFQVDFNYSIDKTRKIYFGCGVGLMLLSFILSIVKLCLKELGHRSKKSSKRGFSQKSYKSTQVEEKANEDFF